MREELKKNSHYVRETQTIPRFQPVYENPYREVHVSQDRLNRLPIIHTPGVVDLKLPQIQVPDVSSERELVYEYQCSCGVWNRSGGCRPNGKRREVG